MQRFNRRATSPIIATILMVAITLVLSATVVVMVMGYNFGSSNIRYGSFSSVEKGANDQYIFTFGNFQPKTLFSEVKTSIGGQITPQALNNYSISGPYGPNSQVASMYFIDLGGEGAISVGDSMVVRFNTSMTGMVVDVSIILIADGSTLARASVTVGLNPNPNPVPTPNPMDYIYTVSNGKATITGYIGTGGAIAIPSIIDGYPVVAIGSYAFSACLSLTSVVIPDSVKSIGGYAFFGCSSLISVTIPDSVTSIGAFSFQYCSSLTSVAIPKSLISIGAYAFQYCNALTAFAVDANNVAYCSIDGALFNKAVTKLIQYPAAHAGTTFIIPSSVTTIGYSAFRLCKSLTSMIIPNSVTSIGNEAFRDCSALKSVVIGSGVTSILVQSFQFCTSLTSITFLGHTAPTIDSVNWIGGTAPGIMGHSFSDAIGFTNPFYNLPMNNVMP